MFPNLGWFNRQMLSFYDDINGKANTAILKLDHVGYIATTAT
jgi:hypothetical protein